MFRNIHVSIKPEKKKCHATRLLESTLARELKQQKFSKICKVLISRKSHKVREIITYHKLSTNLPFNTQLMRLTIRLELWNRKKTNFQSMTATRLDDHVGENLHHHIAIVVPVENSHFVVLSRCTRRSRIFSCNQSIKANNTLTTHSLHTPTTVFNRIRNEIKWMHS